MTLTIPLAVQKHVALTRLGGDKGLLILRILQQDLGFGTSRITAKQAVECMAVLQAQSECDPTVSRVPVLLPMMTAALAHKQQPSPAARAL